MEIAIVNLQKKIPIRAPVIITAVKKILRHERIKTASLSVVFISDPALKKINNKFLKHNFFTDVLTFDYLPVRKAARPQQLHGEIVISVDRALQQAKLYHTVLGQEIILYVIHGMLHLLGFDDHRPSDIKRMRRKEKGLMRLLKMPLPS